MTSERRVERRVERLGQASFPSGRAVVIDAGHLVGARRDWEATGVVIDGVPAGALAILGERADGRWHDVWIELGEGVAASSEFAGTVTIALARLLFVDADGVEAWPDANDEITRLLARARDAATGSTELELAGGRACLLLTGSDDGVVPVFVDRDRAGRPLRIRVHLPADAGDEDEG